jgi:hypothetical protein
MSWQSPSHVGIRGIKLRTFVKGRKWSVGVCLQHLYAEVDLHLIVVSPSARFRQPVDHGRGLRIEGRVTYVLCPDGTWWKVGRRRYNVLQPRRLHPAAERPVQRRGHVV